MAELVPPVVVSSAEPEEDVVDVPDAVVVGPELATVAVVEPADEVPAEASSEPAPSSSEQPASMHRPTRTPGHTQRAGDMLKL